MNNFKIIRFNERHQDSVKKLILDGLEEHWGTLDLTMNKDLNDIGKNYENSIFLLAFLDDELVGSGCAKMLDNKQVEIVRMSVSKKHRRKGIGHRILNKLFLEIKENHISNVYLETSKNWFYVIDFYINFGFEISYYTDEDVYLSYKL